MTLSGSLSRRTTSMQFRRKSFARILSSRVSMILPRHVGRALKDLMKNVQPTDDDVELPEDDLEDMVSCLFCALKFTYI